MTIDGMRAACERSGVPAPPADAVILDIDVVEWRAPPDDMPRGPETPVCFRWRLLGTGGVAFMAYGWNRREVGYGRTAKEPEMGYSLLRSGDRDAAAAIAFTAAPAP